MPAVLLRTSVLVPALLALLVLQIAAFSSVRSDDAFVTYRYAQNLATGRGPVFNPGDKLLGATSPGQMLIAGVVYGAVGRDATPSILAALGCIGWSAQSVALFLLLAGSLGRAGAATVGLAVAIGSTGAHGWVPLETNLLSAALLFAFAAAARSRWHIAAACTAVATVLRPDAWLAVPILAVQCILHRRREALTAGARFAILASPWPLFALYFYGTVLPHSALAKFQRTTFADYLTHAVMYPGSLWFPLPLPGPLQTIVTFAFAGLGAWLLLRRSQALAPFVLHGLALVAAYLYLRPFTVHGWHLYPWVVLVHVLAWSGLIGLVQAQHKPALRLGTSLAIVGLLGVHGVRYAEAVRSVSSGYWTGQRHAAYVDVAGYLRSAAAPGDWFGSVEVGTIAYYSDLPAFDFGGLVTRPSQRLERSPVRFLVVDKLHMQPHDAVPAAFRSQHGDFVAVVYRTR